MSTETLELAFGDLVKMVLDANHPARAKVPMETFDIGPKNGVLKLPTVGEQAAIPTDGNIESTPSYGRVEWLQTSGIPLMGEINTLVVTSKKGRVPVGTTLPTAYMQDEFSNAVPIDPGIIGREFDITSFVEVAVEVSTQIVIQSSEDLLGSIQTALRAAIAEKLLEQVVSGDGQGNNLSGVHLAAGIQTGSYAVADRGADKPFTDAETKVEDADGTPSGWVLGKDLSTATRATLLEPGSDRRVEERGRLSLSGTPVHRDSSIEATSGILGDWRRAVTLVLQGEIQFVFNAVTKPGEMKITARLGVDLLVVRPKLIYLLTEA